MDTARFTSRPSLSRFNAVVPAMRHLSPQAPGVDLVYAKAFLDDADGFGAGNPSELLLALAGAPPAVDFSGGSDRSGGFLTPNLLVRGVSRSLGAVGEDGTKPDSGLAHGQFNAKAFLDGALPKLFGLFSLVDLLDAAGLDLSKAPEFVTEALDTVSAVVSEADRLRTAAQAVGPRLDEEIARAAHDGARNALTALKAQMDAVTGPLVGDLQELVDAVADLPGGTLPAAADRVTSALVQVAADIDGLLGGDRLAAAAGRRPRHPRPSGPGAGHPRRRGRHHQGGHRLRPEPAVARHRGHGAGSSGGRCCARSRRGPRSSSSSSRRRACASPSRCGPARRRRRRSTSSPSSPSSGSSSCRALRSWGWPSRASVSGSPPAASPRSTSCSTASSSSGRSRSSTRCAG